MAVKLCIKCVKLQHMQQTHSVAGATALLASFFSETKRYFSREENIHLYLFIPYLSFYAIIFHSSPARGRSHGNHVTKMNHQ